MTEEFLEYHKVEDHYRVTVAGLHLEGDAAHWLRWFKMRYPISSWATFTTQLLQSFGPSDSLNFNMALSHISQTTIVEAYVGHFISPSCRTLDWTDAQLLGAFLGGLKDELQDDVVAQGPVSLSRAIELAQIYKHKQGCRPAACSGFFRASSYNPRPPMLHPSTPLPQPLNCGQQPPHPTLPQISQFFGLPKLKCALAVSKAFASTVITNTENDSLDPTSELAETVLLTPAVVEHLKHPLALHAISATKHACGHAMCLEGLINHILIQVFINSGADQSFLNPQVATRLGLPVDHSWTEAVIVVTCRCFHTKGLAHQVSVCLQGYTFTSDFHLLVVAGYDMVLGVNWLKTLGFIGWNFLLKVMEFSMHVTNYRLVGSFTSPQLGFSFPPGTKESIAYLGHIISAKGVTVDPSKIAAIMEWPTPSSVCVLWGFLGLAGYYRTFVSHFGLIAKPLTDLLKKDEFLWSKTADSAFSALKDALSTTSVLALSDFTKPFTIEYNVSNVGIEAVLSQDHHSIEFLSKPMAPKHQTFSVYDKEMLAVVFTVQKWCPYLLGHHFKILTDHQTLRYNYTLEYRSGASNTVVDALSRRPELLALIRLSTPLFDCVAELQASYTIDIQAFNILTGRALCYSDLFYLIVDPSASVSCTVEVVRNLCLWMVHHFSTNSPMLGSFSVKSQHHINCFEVFAEEIRDLTTVEDEYLRAMQGKGKGKGNDREIA
ncbi:uncharacterized protein [Pyrus communis]|uniref:uncharacterized protein n=1 Tax=Pyrus communis TaxID=23211 RepID=UPI0035C1851C